VLGRHGQAGADSARGKLGLALRCRYDGTGVSRRHRLQRHLQDDVDVKVCTYGGVGGEEGDLGEVEAGWKTPTGYRAWTRGAANEGIGTTAAGQASGEVR